METSLPMLRCTRCLEAVDMASAIEQGRSGFVRCEGCGVRFPLLGVAAAAWREGSISRAEFFEVVEVAYGDDIEGALSAFAAAASWWEARAEAPGDQDNGT